MKMSPALNQRVFSNPGRIDSAAIPVSTANRPPGFNALAIPCRNSTSVCPVQVPKTVAEAICAIELRNPRKLAHVATNPPRWRPTICSRTSAINSSLRSTPVIEYPRSRKLKCVTPISTGNIEKLSARRDAQHPFQELYFRSGLFWSHDAAPKLERDTAKKIQLANWIAFLLLQEDTPSAWWLRPRRRSYRTAIVVVRGALSAYQDLARDPSSLTAGHKATSERFTIERGGGIMERHGSTSGVTRREMLADNRHGSICGARRAEARRSERPSEHSRNCAMPQLWRFQWKTVQRL